MPKRFNVDSLTFFVFVIFFHVTTQLQLQSYTSRITQIKETTLSPTLVPLQTHLQLLNLRLGRLLCFADCTPPVTLKTQRRAGQSPHLESPECTRTHPTHVRDPRRVHHVELRTVVFVVRTQNEAERSKHMREGLKTKSLIKCSYCP